MTLRTEFSFTLPKGFVDDDGMLHRQGEMRLATARDEIEPLRDRSIQGPDDPYLTILVLARVITRIGSLESVSEREVERLFAADLAFLQDLYGLINFGDQADVEALQASVLPASDADDLFDDDFAEADEAEADEAEADLAEADQDDEIEAVPPSSRRRGRIEEVTRSASR